MGDLSVLLQVILGGAISLLTTWMTLKRQLDRDVAIRKMEFQQTQQRDSGLKLEQKYGEVVSKLNAILPGAPVLDPNDRQQFLRAVREVWVFGDPQVVVRLHGFMLHVIGQAEATPDQRLFGDLVLSMRQDLGRSNEGLNNEMFRFVAS